MALLAASVSGIDLNPFIQFGAVGVVAALGLVFIWQAYRREVKRADDNEKEIARLNQAIIDKYLPALQEMIGVLIDVKDLLRDWRQPPEPPGRRRS